MDKNPEVGTNFQALAMFRKIWMRELQRKCCELEQERDRLKEMVQTRDDELDSVYAVRDRLKGALEAIVRADDSRSCGGVRPGVIARKALAGECETTKVSVPIKFPSGPATCDGCGGAFGCKIHCDVHSGAALCDECFGKLQRDTRFGRNVGDTNSPAVTMEMLEKFRELCALQGNIPDPVCDEDDDL